MNERDGDEWPEEFLYFFPLLDAPTYEPINYLPIQLEVPIPDVPNPNDQMIPDVNQNDVILIEDSNETRFMFEPPFPWDTPESQESEFIPPMAIINEPPEDASSGIFRNEVITPLAQEEVHAQHIYIMQLENELRLARSDTERANRMLNQTQVQLGYTQEELARSYHEISCLTSELLGDPYMRGFASRRMSGGHYSY